MDNRLKMLEVLFEHTGVPALYLQSKASLALHASGRTSGVILNSGHDSTTCVAISDNNILLETFQKTDVAGKALTDYLVQKMIERGVAWTTSVEMERANQIKEQFCYVALDCDVEMDRFARDLAAHRKSIIDAFGQEVIIEREQFLVGEALFYPGSMGHDVPGLDRLVYAFNVSTLSDIS